MCPFMLFRWAIQFSLCHPFYPTINHFLSERNTPRASEPLRHCLLSISCVGTLALRTRPTNTKGWRCGAEGRLWMCYAGQIFVPKQNRRRPNISILHYINTRTQWMVHAGQERFDCRRLNNGSVLHCNLLQFMLRYANCVSFFFRSMPVRYQFNSSVTSIKMLAQFLNYLYIQKLISFCIID